MQPVSSKWMPALMATSYQIYARMDVYGSIGGPLLGSLPLIDGTVTLDVANANRRQAQITVSPVNYSVGKPVSTIPMSSNDELWPDGREGQVFKGIVYDDGTTEEVSLGIFLLEDVEPVFATGNLSLTASGMDRSGTIGRAKFNFPWTAIATTTLVFDIDAPATGTVEVIGVQNAFAGVAPFVVTIDVTHEQVLVLSQGSFDGIPFIQAQRGYNGTTPQVATAGTFCGVDAAVTCQAIIDQAVPGLQYNMAPTAAPVWSPSFNVGDDPWAGAQAVATAASCDLFIDVNGVVTMTPLADPNHVAPCANYKSGPGGILISVNPKKINTNTPNVVIAIGQTSNTDDPTLTAMEWDSSPGSDTFYGIDGPPTPPTGTYPTTTQVINSTTATTQDAVNGIAFVGILAAQNMFQTIVFSIRDNPAQDGNDVVGVSEPKTGTTGNWTVDQINYPIGVSGTMQITGRQVGLLTALSGPI